MGEEGIIRISYLMVTRNRANYLEKSLANVREFIGPADEFIIVDGNSTDNTAAIVAQNRDIVTVFVSEPDRSEGHAVNKAIALTRGRFIKFVTDDDYIHPAAMIELIKVADENPSIDAFQCGGEIWDCQGDAPVFERKRGISPSTVSSLTPVEFFWQLHHGLGLLVRRDVLVFIGGASAGYVSVDGDVICKILEAGCRVAYLDICLYRWNIFRHSGVLKEAPIVRDHVMFDMRLGNWTPVWKRNPTTLARALRAVGTPNMEGFLIAVILLNYLRASPVGWILDVVFRPLWATARIARNLLRLIRPKTSKQEATDTTVSSLDAARPFTGVLAVLSARIGV
jgi:glycosyltransferase involved in cell wall biosynthesis